MSSKVDSVALYKMRKVLSELSTKAGRGTELISLYIPTKKALHEVASALRDEYGTASNIKSDTTRNHVQDALTKTIQRLKLYKETPPNGLIIFCGALPTNGPGSEVIRMYEVLPHKPVHTYLYRCLSPDTRILLDDGSEKTIGELKNCWTHHKVMSYDNETHKLTRSSIQEYLELPLDGRRAYIVTAESGRKIIATEDHPFLMPKGWVRLQHLGVGDVICVWPLADLALKYESNMTSDRLIVSEESLQRISYPPKNLRLAIKKLKKRGLLPLTEKNSKLPIIARLLGHLFSDGSLYQTVERRNSGDYSYFTIDLCVGNKVDEDELRNDVSMLGSKMPEGREVTYIMNLDGRSYTARTRHIKLRDAALCALLRALGAPVGDKVRNGTEIPTWLTQAPLHIHREFLAAYLGGDGEAPRVSGRNLVGASRLTFHRIEEEKESALSFAHQLRELFARFDVTVNAINCIPGYKRKDGHKTVEIELRFKLSEDNMLKLLHGIGIRYCSKKAMQASLVGEYLRVKAFLRTEMKSKIIQAQRMRAEGSAVNAISQLLGVSGTTISQWTRYVVRTPKIQGSRLPPFYDWLAEARAGLAQPLLWERIISVEPTSLSEVRDLTITHDSHSFFANGFLVHNCDDHFHLEPIREMLKEEKIIGILSMDTSEAGLGIVSGDRTEVIEVLTSGVSGKTRKGGQSQRRYERLRDMELTYYYNRLAEHAVRVFIDEYPIKGLIVSGPGPTKDNFLKEGYLDYRLKDKVVAVVDTSYAGREGVRDTLDRARSALEEMRIIEERDLVRRLLKEMSSEKGLAVTEVEPVLAALKRGAVDVVLISEEANIAYVKATCRRCNLSREKIVEAHALQAEEQAMKTQACSSCGAVDADVESSDLVDYVSLRAGETGARIEVIASKTEEGIMFRNLGGVGAILRFRM